jgi:hypothetical protein
MRIAAAVAAGLLLTAPLIAQAPAAPAASQAAKEVREQGELETFVAIGGESTGFRLRTRTAEGARRYVEVALTVAQAKSVKLGVPVVITGTMETRHYVERGDTQVLVAKTITEANR